MPAQPSQHEQRDYSAFANASMVLAIASLPAALIIGLGIPLGVAAIICGIVGRRSKNRHLAKFGIFVGSVGTAVSIASVVLWFVLWRASQ